MFILPHGDIYLATFRARLAGPSSQNCRRWEPSANPGGRCYERKKEKRKASVLQADLGAAAYFPSSGQTGCSYEMGIAKRLKTCCCEFQSCLAGTAGTMKVPVY